MKVRPTTGAPMALALVAALLTGCGGIGGAINVDEVANNVSRDLQLKIDRALASAGHGITHVIVYREIRCPGNVKIHPGTRLVCRTYGSLLDGSQEQNYYVNVTVLDGRGNVAYTISPPPGYVPPPGATPMPGFTPPKQPLATGSPAGAGGRP